MFFGWISASWLSAPPWDGCLASAPTVPCLADRTLRALLHVAQLAQLRPQRGIGRGRVWGRRRARCPAVETRAEGGGLLRGRGDIRVLPRVVREVVQLGTAVGQANELPAWCAERHRAPLAAVPESA